MLAGKPVGRPEATLLAKAAATDPLELMYWADKLRKRNFGNLVRLCSIVPGKLGACKEDCKWCAQSIRFGPGRSGKGTHGKGHPAKVRPKRATLEEIHAAARAAAINGAASLGIVNSGRGPTQRDLDEVVAAVSAIRSDNHCHIEACASLGSLTAEQAAQLSAAGVHRYHHNLETSRRFFPRMVTTHGYDERLQTLQAARKAGIKLCCGGLFGLGETWADRVDLAMTIRDEVAPEVVPLNFLQPIPGTPLEALQAKKLLTPMQVLGIIAMFRLILPNVDLKVAGGRQHNLRDLQSWIFYAGATSTMVGGYLTTCGREVPADLAMIGDLGLRIVRRFPRS